MPSFNVEIKGLDQLTRAVRSFPRISEPILQRAIEASSAEIMKQSRQTGAVPVKTGFLKMSFNTISGRLFAKTGPSIVYPVKYAIMVHEGTRAHVIKPKDKKALFWKGASHPVMGVKHPGTKPNQFMPRILEASRSDITRHFERAVELITEAIAKS